MMGWRERLQGGDERDVFSRNSRRILVCTGRAGYNHRVKSRFKRRVRRKLREILKTVVGASDG